MKNLFRINRVLAAQAKMMVALLVMLACMACRNQVEQAAGTYSYKISGRVTVLGVEQALTDEIGTMEILPNTTNSAVVTFNALRGPAYYTTAKINGKQIVLNPFEREVTQSAVEYGVTVSGDGTVYDQTILITLRYSGTSLNADSLLLLCKKN
ncbi:MAG: hypothetical protein IJ814_01725 [Paludibacteraceae bacterium]|nr:hypothetical protein [Paludibacteraceae bacterium]